MRSDVYICYSSKQKDWLCKEKGFKYVINALNPNSHKMFWLFMRNEEFNKVLSEWFEK